MINLNKNDLWLGDEASLRSALDLEARMLEAEARGQAVEPAADGASPRMYSVKDGVGVITVRGPLVNMQESDLTAFFGIANYPAIREAFVHAAQDEAATQVLLDIDSPGGMVSGVNDTANLIAQVNAVKPVTVHADGLLASAAYWLASGASKIVVGDTSIVGSIGVIATMVSEHEALKKEGIQVKVVRAGKNKALGHPAEPISDKAVAQTQQRVDAIYSIFTSTVAAGRPNLSLDKTATWADGNEFLGAEALAAGLADSVGTFDKTFASLVQNVDSSKGYNNNANKTRGMQMKPRATLDPQLVAKIAAGAQLSAEEQAAVAAANAAVDTDEAKAAAEAAAQAEAKAKADADAAAAAEAKAKADADAEAALAAQLAAPQAELVKFLQTELKAAQDKVTALTVEKTGLEAKIADMGASHTKLCEIARNSITTMTIALGGHKASLDALSGTELVARHASTLTDFQKAFPVGGVASTETDEGKQAVAQPAARHLQLVAAVGLSNKKK